MSQTKTRHAGFDELIGAFEAELNSIARWWLDHAPDHDNGGLIGEIGIGNTPKPAADKGCIYHARALWFFSELARVTAEAEHRRAAEALYRYIDAYFLDREYGGVYWSLDWRGRPIKTRKHLYAQSFAVYGLSAYHRMSGEPHALSQALAIYELMEVHCRDKDHGGYHECFTRAWGRLDDVRLSEKELNVPKTMNTHLHVLEAYTALYTARPDRTIGESLRRIIDDFRRHIIDPGRCHLRVFMDSDWRDLSTYDSYGHDIECSWLLWEALGMLNDAALRRDFEPLVTGMAGACLEQGLGEHGELLDGYDLQAGRLKRERPWWVQAEALVGFINTFQITGQERFYNAFVGAWAFIKEYQIDRVHGEWLMHSRLDALEAQPENYKAGFWKAPYHNGRAMMEVSARLRRLQAQADESIHSDKVVLR